jgi:integrase
LDAAKRYRPQRDDVGMPFAYPLIATFLLTGGRPREILGLEYDDANLQNQTVTFRPNTWRRLKNAWSARTVPLWPQLEAILQGYFREYEQLYGSAKLLFPSFRSGEEAMLTDFRKLLRAVVKLADLPIRTKLGRKLSPKAFRHTYCATFEDDRSRRAGGYV